MEIAVLMAAGLGSRLRPLTYSTPKPMLKVNGRPMIETVIDGLNRRGVENIYIVTGYLAGQFAYLPQKYKNVELLFNPDFKSANNISSVYYARDIICLADCFICEADLFVADSRVFQTILTQSCYFGKMVNGHSDDWVFDVDGSGRITHIGKGGEDCFNMTGISFFKRSDAQRLADMIRTTYEKGGSEDMFWDEVVDKNINRIKLSIHPIREGQITEIDTVDEFNQVNTKFMEA